MIRSSDRILTTHTGSLPRPESLVALLRAKDGGRPFDQGELKRQVQSSVVEVVNRQARIGIDVIDDGEHGKSSFAAYLRTRLGGFEPTGKPFGFQGASRDSLQFSAAYEEMRAMFSARASTAKRATVSSLVCTGPVSYIGQDQVAADIEILKAALEGKSATEAFVTALSPTNIELYYKNEYYRSREEYLTALADAMREEYKAIVDAGFLLQIDDPRMATYYDRTPAATEKECRAFIAESVEVVNYALRDIPEDKVRFHTCYSINVAPRVHDMELVRYVDLMLKVKAMAFSIEAANPRHEHEWQLWENHKLPEGKVLIPGVVSHCVYQVEHPELVAQRIARFAGVVGRENVIAGTDCGFATSAAGDEVHAQVAWAKLESLVEGARLASRRLWGKL